MKEIKYIDLSVIPKQMIGNKEKYDWCSINNLPVKFIYDDVEGIVIIKDYDKKTNMLTIIYNNKEYNIRTQHFINVKLGVIIGKRNGDFAFNINDKIKDCKRDLTIIQRERRYNNKGGKWYKYQCSREDCGYEGWIVETDINRGLPPTIILKSAIGCEHPLV